MSYVSWSCALSDRGKDVYRNAYSTMFSDSCGCLLPPDFFWLGHSHHATKYGRCWSASRVLIDLDTYAPAVSGYRLGHVCKVNSSASAYTIPATGFRIRLSVYCTTFAEVLLVSFFYWFAAYCSSSACTNFDIAWWPSPCFSLTLCPIKAIWTNNFLSAILFSPCPN